MPIRIDNDLPVKQILEEEALARTTHQEELKRMIDSAMAASRGRGASMMKR